MGLIAGESHNQGWIQDADGRQVVALGGAVSVTAAASMADGADVSLGATTDAVVAAGATGSLQAKIRRLTADMGTLLTQTDGIEASLTAIDGHVDQIEGYTDGIETLLAGGLPAALGAGGGLKVEGNLAIDAPATSGPMLAGGRASTAVPSAVSTDGDAQANWLTRTGAQVVDGGVASAATDSGGPVKVGGVYLTNGAAITNGQRGDAQLTINGSLRTSAGMSAVAGSDALSNTLGYAKRDDQSGSATATVQAVVNAGIFNGSTWDRPRANVDVALLASSARTTTQTGADTTNYTGKGIKVVLDVTSAGTGSITVSIQGKDANGIYYTILAGAAVTTVSTNVYTIFPGAPVTANVSANDFLPRVYRVIVTANNANSMTYSVSTNVQMA